MLTTSLPLLPPPASSLLPPLRGYRNTENSGHHDGQSSQHSEQQQRRRARGQQHSQHARSELAILAHDERLLAQRRMAIRMYGYSWLKPAGCTKTMLGRHEEELERDEVEKQLREVEMQEQNQAQMDDADRQAHLNEQGVREARGEVIGAEGERDLDADVPEADAADDFDDEDGSLGDEENEDGELDLDRDIPEADSGWHYDTTRELSDSENEQPISSQLRAPAQSRPGNVGSRALSPVQPQSMSARHEDHSGLVQDMNVNFSDDEVGDLDDNIPEAGDNGDWEHTDTEMEESDMDISIMPPGAMAHQVSTQPRSANTDRRSRRQQPRQSTDSQQSPPDSSMRSTSGNVPLSMAPPPTTASSRRDMPRTQHLPTQFTPDQFENDASVSALISTGNIGEVSSTRGVIPQRSWLDPASARRNLFGISRNAPVQSAIASGSSSAHHDPTRSHSTSIQAPRQVSSGGLFTPSPQQQNVQRQQIDLEPQSRTRSGRVIGRPAGGRA